MDSSTLPELQKLMERQVRLDAPPFRPLPNLTLMSVTAPTPPIAEITEPTFALVARGTKHVGLGNRIISYGAGQYLIVSVDLPLEAHVAEASPDSSYLGLGISLRPEVIASLLLETGSAPPSTRDPSGIAVSDLDDDLIEPVVRLLRLLDRPKDIPVLAAGIEREILWRLINGAQGAMVRQIGLADSRMAQIGRAVRYIRKHFAEPLKIEELARVAGMSVTSFHRHFAGVTSLTPIQYLKQIRLQTARSLLFGSRGDVASIGHEVGYDSPSQFSREYRRQFGEAPGKSGRKMREASAWVSPKKSTGDAA